MTSFHNLESSIPGPISASLSGTQGGRRMRESRTYGVVRGAPSNGRPYRDQEATFTDLLDHFVGGGEQLIRDGEAERLRGLEIEHKLEFGRPLDRQICRILTLE